MSGKKGRSGRKRKPRPIQEVLKENEKRIPELVEIAYKLALDETIVERDRIKAIALIMERVLPKSAQGVSERGLIITADDLELYYRQPNVKKAEADYKLPNGEIITRRS